jgi:hypothetical protein
MLIARHEKSAEHLGRTLPIFQLDASVIEHTREIFSDYCRRGIIVGGKFDDSEWRLSNEVKDVTFELLSFTGAGTEDVQDWIGIDTREYTDCLKAYIVLKFGTFALGTLNSITKALTALPNITADKAAAITHNASHISEFLLLLPGDSSERDIVAETLDERVRAYQITTGIRGRRVLEAWENYLRFNEILSEFWLTASDDDKLFYFPVYLWWNLTAILPLRPTEFLLTPYDCLDGNILTIRRTKLKGLGGKVNYRIAQDYELYRYEITPALAAEINSYIALTKHMPETELGTLLRLDAHYNRLRMSAAERNRYYTYNNMRTCLSAFLLEIGSAAGFETDTINLGDTRHLAMISIIISGGSPTICKELAGHADVAVSSHYYSNISKLVETVTFARFQKSKGGGAEFAGEPQYPLTRPADMTRLTDGWCDSEALKVGEVSDCMKVADSYGRLGECSVCGHFWPDVQGMRLRFFDESDGEQCVNLDSAFLLRMVESVRKGIGCEEDIASAILRLQHSCNHYDDCLTMKYLNAEVD